MLQHFLVFKKSLYMYNAASKRIFSQYKCGVFVPADCYAMYSVHMHIILL